jgi:hypothetical protein
VWDFWIVLVTTIVLAGFSNAFAQASYKVTDLGTLHNAYFGCNMGLNNHGWTENSRGKVQNVCGDSSDGSQYAPRGW